MFFIKDNHTGEVVTRKNAHEVAMFMLGRASVAYEVFYAAGAVELPKEPTYYAIARALKEIEGSQ